jgi:hypothetical protein
MSYISIETHFHHLLLPEVFPRREHPALQQLLAAAVTDLLRPVHPAIFVM